MFWLLVRSALYSFIFVFGVLCNGFLIYFFSLKMKKAPQFRWLIVHLAVADALVATVTPVHALYLTFTRERWLLGEALCKMSHLGSVVVNVSTWILCMMGFERYRAICHPFKRRLTRTHIHVSVATFWIVNVALRAGFVYRSTVTYEDCRPLFQSRSEVLVNSLITLVSECLVPLSLLSYFLLRVVVALRKRARYLESLAVKKPSAECKKNRLSLLGDHTVLDASNIKTENLTEEVMLQLMRVGLVSATRRISTTKSLSSNDSDSVNYSIKGGMESIYASTISSLGEDIRSLPSIILSPSIRGSTLSTFTTDSFNFNNPKDNGRFLSVPTSARSSFRVSNASIHETLKESPNEGSESPLLSVCKPLITAEAPISSARRIGQSTSFLNVPSVSFSLPASARSSYRKSNIEDEGEISFTVPNSARSSYREPEGEDSSITFEVPTLSRSNLGDSGIFLSVPPSARSSYRVSNIEVDDEKTISLNVPQIKMNIPFKNNASQGADAENLLEKNENENLNKEICNKGPELDIPVYFKNYARKRSHSNLENPDTRNLCVSFDPLTRAESSQCVSACGRPAQQPHIKPCSSSISLNRKAQPNLLAKTRRVQTERQERKISDDRTSMKSWTSRTSFRERRRQSFMAFKAAVSRKTSTLSLIRGIQVKDARDRATIKVFYFSVLLFVLTIVPYSFFYFVVTCLYAFHFTAEEASRYMQRFSTANTWLSFLVLSGSLLNIFIYGGKFPEFRANAILWLQNRQKRLRSRSMESY